MVKNWLLIIIIILLALGLRAFRLTEIPPGLTHDEANHGREAIEILAGQLRYYFPLNYGSEPLYSYIAAGSMAILGEGLFALRLVNVVFGLAAIAAFFIWVKQAFDQTTALLTAVLIAVSFWPLASSRESLRAGLLPFFMVLAVWFFWQIIFDNEGQLGVSESRPEQKRRQVWMVLGFALSILLTLHIYLAARVSWLLFPLFLVYLAFFQRSIFRRSWRPVVLGLVLAGLLSIPMFVYLANNPESQTRLSMLGSTLEQIKAGNLNPLLQNMGEALLAFVWPGYGDQFLAYNIPGRPVLDMISAVFFLIGIAVSLWRWKKPAYAFILIWFITAIIPSLVTGPTANTTRNLAALPVTYLFPALGLVFSLQYLARRLNVCERRVIGAGAVVLIILVGLISVRDYFFRWAQAPEVRSAYQKTLVEELAYLQEKRLDLTQIIFSTVYPGPAHDPSIALVLGGPQTQQSRWVDARKAFVIPQGGKAQALIPASTPPHPAFKGFLQPLETISLRPDDLDPQFTYYTIDSTALASQENNLQANFGGALMLEGARWLSPQVAPGETAELLTRWRVLEPTQAGPTHSPTGTTAAVIFAHVLDGNEQILAQNDSLDAPSWNWQSGDIILQVHQISVPDDAPPGLYPAVIGIYDQPTGQRLTLVGEGDAISAVKIPPIEVARSKK